MVRLRWDAEAPLVYTGCLDGVVRLWDCRSGNCEREWFGHNGEILDLAVARYNSRCTHYYVNKASHKRSGQHLLASDSITNFRLKLCDRKV